MEATSLIEKKNPSTGQLLATYPIATGSDISDSVSKAHLALGVWQTSNLNTRAELLKSIASIIYEHADSLAQLISEETGKPLADALEVDIGVSINLLRYYARVGASVLAPQAVDADFTTLVTGYQHRITYQARGVIAVVSPWNYPLAIPVSGIATALMTGCPVILKPSELTPGTGITLVGLIQQVLQQEGLPLSLVQCLTGKASVGKILIDSNINGVVFTGSAQAGRMIQKNLLERNIWSSIELGGSDAMLVLENVPVEVAASYAVWGRFLNSGQACASVKRLFVPVGQKEEWLVSLTRKIKEIQVGAPSLREAHIGPLVSEAQRLAVEEQVSDAIQLGATVLTGGKRLPDEGYFYEPTLLSDIPLQARVLQEEVFGPVLPVVFYDSVETAIDQINQSAFGLTASIFGDPAIASQLASRLQAGTVVINGSGLCNYAMPSVPWSGIKQSGSGTSHSKEALLEMAVRKVQTVNRCFSIPVLNKPMWHFPCGNGHSVHRAKALLDCINTQSLRVRHLFTLLRQCLFIRRI